MNIQVFWSEKLNTPQQLISTFTDFAQRVANRLLQGYTRYGVPAQTSDMMDRLEMEFKAYKKTGNLEHLYNVGAYCVLEIVAPQNIKQHHDATVGSATRGKK